MRAFTKKILKDKKERISLTKATLLGLMLAVLVAGLFLSNSGIVYAENIYTTDGKVIQAKITEKTEDTIWYETTNGDVSEFLGIDISKVVKVLNDDGSVSKYSPTYSAPKQK